MPRSACVVGLAKTGVIPRKQFYSKLFIFNTVILEWPRAMLPRHASLALNCLPHACSADPSYSVLLFGLRHSTDIAIMDDYSPQTRVEPTWAGWLFIAQGHYEAAIRNNSDKLAQQRAQMAGRRALREATSLFPNVRRFAASASSSTEV
jgi:hypothetical protein